MNTLNDILRENSERWTGSAVTISVSSGVSGFASLEELRDAIERADQAMYQSRKSTRSSERFPIPPSNLVLGGATVSM
jgi:GGDEF domain-containing protein